MGFHAQVLSATNSNVILNNNETGESVQNTIDQSEARHKALFYGLAGIVVKHKLGGGTLSAGLRYAIGFNNVVNPDRRWNDLNFIFTNQYVDSDFSFRPLYVSLGYQIPLPGMYAVKLRK